MTVNPAARPLAARSGGPTPTARRAGPSIEPEAERHSEAVWDAQRCQDRLRHIQCELLAPHGPIHATRREGIVYWGEQLEQIVSVEIERELRRSLPWHPALGDG